MSTGRLPAKTLANVALALLLALLPAAGSLGEAQASADIVAHGKAGKGAGRSAVVKHAPAKPAAAAASPVKPMAQLVPDADTETTQSTVAVGGSDDAIDCYKRRKRLFVDGYGWVVRRVNICE